MSRNGAQFSLGSHVETTDQSLANKLPVHVLYTGSRRLWHQELVDWKALKKTVDTTKFVPVFAQLASGTTLLQMTLFVRVKP